MTSGEDTGRASPPWSRERLVMFTQAPCWRQAQEVQERIYADQPYLFLYWRDEVIAIDGAMGIMGNGTFSNMLSYREEDWVRIREQIQSTNAADKAKRS